MKKALALGLAGALAALVGAGSAHAQGFGVSIGYGSAAYDDFDHGWGGPRYVSSHHAYDDVYAPRTVVTTRRVVSSPVYEEYYDEPRPVVRSRRVVYRAPAYYAPRRVVRSQRVVYRAPAYRPARVVTTRRVVEEPFYGERRVMTRTIQY